ncbi:MAG: hypothetical protein H0U27_06715 [Nitrosopumilus sp.]|nr:hypothetical protein [Nitrosopumilus sp.]
MQSKVSKQEAKYALRDLGLNEQQIKDLDDTIDLMIDIVLDDYFEKSYGNNKT